MKKQKVSKKKDKLTAPVPVKQVRDKLAKQAEQGTTALAANDVFDVKDNVRGVIGRIPQIKIIHQGQMFGMPTGKKVEEFTARILHHTPANAYWEKAFDETGGGNIPDCFSMDAMHPRCGDDKKVQAPVCTVCRRNEFGTDGRGKACKNIWRLHVLLADSNIPKRLTLPPSNLGQIQDFLIALADANIAYPLATVKFSLSPTKNKDGIEYSLINFEIIDFIDQFEEKEKALEIKNIIDVYASAFGQAIIPEEYAE